MAVKCTPTHWRFSRRLACASTQIFSIGIGAEARVALAGFLREPLGLHQFDDSINEPSTVIETGSRHHIIPYSTLRRFIEAAIEHGRVDDAVSQQLINFFVRLSTFAEIPIEWTEEQRRRISTGIVLRVNLPSFLNSYPPINTVNLSRRPLAARNDRIFGETILSLYFWMPFLWFYGYAPPNRADDPGDGFEHNSGRIVDAIHNLDRLLYMYPRHAPLH